MTALRIVGLEGREDHYPRQLSGGQEQRVSIARAIVTDPYLIVADEPTGDLDRKSADEILGQLGVLNRDFNKTIVMVTHDPRWPRSMPRRILHLDKGKLVDDVDSRAPGSERRHEVPRDGLAQRPAEPDPVVSYHRLARQSACRWRWS